MATTIIRLAVWASGNGSNAQNLILSFKNHPKIRVVLVVSNQAEAPVVAKASALKVPVLLLGPKSWRDGQELLQQLRAFDIDALVLAGFLRKIPEYLLEAFPHKIVNLHPSLLPEFGGQGMYGLHVHRAVLEAGKSTSGITIHVVDRDYDTGPVLAQFPCDVLPGDQPETLAERIHALEHAHYPEVVATWIEGWRKS
ncbi:MAG: phosphoribosylglycinamide formyltransferase [Bacteroidota bacterium]